MTDGLSQVKVKKRTFIVLLCDQLTWRHLLVRQLAKYELEQYPQFVSLKADNKILDYNEIPFSITPSKEFLITYLQLDDLANKSESKYKE